MSSLDAPLRLSTSGSPLAQQLLRAGRRERPRDDGKVAAVATAVAAATGRGLWSQLNAVRWLRWLLIVVAIAGGGAGAAAIFGLAPLGARLVEDEDLLTDRSATIEPRAAVPASFPPPATPRIGATRSTALSPAEPEPEPVTEPVTEPFSEKPTELDVLREARIASSKGDATAALAALDTYARLYPKGALREEAAALRVDALARSGDAKAAIEAAARFARAYPESAYLERVRTVAANARAQRPLR